jgi:hypothetical protein
MTAISISTMSSQLACLGVKWIVQLQKRGLWRGY